MVDEREHLTQNDEEHRYPDNHAALGPALPAASLATPDVADLKGHQTNS